MKVVVFRIWTLLPLVFLSGLLTGCASTYSGKGIVEITDEADMQGCKKLGIVTGKTHWAGFTGQELSLDIAKKRALNRARDKGATRIIWTKTKTGFFGASVSGNAYACDKGLGYAAVMRFEFVSIDSGVSIVITDIFTNQIQTNGKYRVMERSQMNKILGEQGFQNSGVCNSAQCAVEIGRLLSIDKMFIGSIGKLGETWVVNIRIIDIKTGEILSTLSRQVTGKVDNLSSAAIQMANEFSH
jgi:hypothetical protein